MRKTAIFVLLLAFQTHSFAILRQVKDTTNFDSIRNLEFRLEGLSNNILNGEDQATRITSTYYFIQNLKKVLRIKNSFNYEFKKLKTISILKPEDEKFRIFTWNLLLDSSKYMYFGVIQMNDKDSFQIFGLYDSSRYVKKPSYDILDHRHWMGALYYQIHTYEYKRKKYYLLMGWDGEDAYLNKKYIEVLTFDKQGAPKFGSPIFDNGGDVQSRMVFTFAEEATMLLHYDNKEKQIIFANTVPPNPNLKGQFRYYLPDGTYDFFKYKKGYWIRYSYLFQDAKNPQLYRKE
ncbi:MAG: hypothetical protein H6605_02060 [Flavobacteriales bacterium]|nr:hypothetical protein [Flavobacteriales bacterium]